MRIHHAKLADGTYTHNDEGERAIRDMLEAAGLTTFDTNEPGVKNALQDYGVDRFRVEQKITKCRDGFHMEFFHDEDQTTPSAFSLCTADLTLILQPGTSGKYGNVWKVRFFRTCDLVAAASPDFMDGDFRRKHPIIEPWGAYCIHINNFYIPHVWAGDVVRADDNIIDTDAFIPNPDLLTKFQECFSEQMMALPPLDYYKTFGKY